MLPARASAILSVFAPLPLVGVLAAYELPALISLMWHDAFFALAALVFCAAYLVGVVRVRRPEFSLAEGAKGWFLVPSLGFCVYLVGSFYGGAVLHWEGLLVMYMGLVAYLAGRRFAALVFPGAVPIALLPLSSLIGSALSTSLGAVLLVAAAFSLLVSVRAKKGSQRGCSECGGYREKGEQFCGFCGASLNAPVRLGVPARRLAVTWLTSAVVVAILIGTTVPLASVSTTGLLVVDHRLSGVSGVTALPAIPGWNSTLTGSGGNQTLTTYSYHLVGGSSVNASLALSTKDGVAALSLIESHPGASANGTASLATGEAAVFYTWSEGGVGYTGTLVTSHVTYLSSGYVVQSYAAFLFSQPSTEAGTSRNALLALAGYTSSAFQQAREGGPFLSTVVGPISSNYDYALMAASAVFLGMVVGVAKSSDSEAMRRCDNAFALPPSDFAALASLDKERGRWTGRELEETMNLPGGWGSLSPLLERLVALGLFEKEIAVVDGLPSLFWANRMPL